MMNHLAFLLFTGMITGGNTKDIPVINPNFVANTKELDETNTTIVEQRLVFDIDLRRSMMYAEGSLVKGAMQQIRRCDIHPEGWMTSSGGPNVQDPSTWTCTNTTISAQGELPMNCQYSTFWSFPADMKYEGVDEMNGTACDKWVYSSSGEEYALWSTTAAGEDGEMYSVPVANGKVRSLKGGLWTIFYSDFIPGSPAEEEYAPVEGNNCPESTPP